MISSQDSNSIFVSYLQGDEKSDSLDAVVSSINIITHKKIIGVRYVASNFEKFHKIMKLAMDVTTDNNGCSNRDNIGLFLKYFFGLKWG